MAVYVQSPSHGSVPEFLQLALSSMTSFTYDSNLTSSITSFHFFATLFIFVGRFPLSIIHFCKMPHGFITGRQEGNTTTCSVV